MLCFRLFGKKFDMIDLSFIWFLKKIGPGHYKPHRLLKPLILTLFLAPTEYQPCKTLLALTKPNLISKMPKYEPLGGNVVKLTRSANLWWYICIFIFHYSSYLQQNYITNIIVNYTLAMHWLFLIICRDIKTSKPTNKIGLELTNSIFNIQFGSKKNLLTPPLPPFFILIERKKRKISLILPLDHKRTTFWKRILDAYVSLGYELRL